MQVDAVLAAPLQMRRKNFSRCRSVHNSAQRRYEHKFHIKAISGETPLHGCEKGEKVAFFKMAKAMSESENPTENAKRRPFERHLGKKMCIFIRITRYWGKWFMLKKKMHHRGEIDLQIVFSSKFNFDLRRFNTYEWAQSTCLVQSPIWCLYRCGSTMYYSASVCLEYQYRHNCNHAGKVCVRTRYPCL